MKHGDRNTTFFHVKAKQRETRNHIARLIDAAGKEYKDEDQITELHATFLEELFTTSANVTGKEVLNKVESRVSSNQFAQLAAPLTGNEVYEYLLISHIYI